MCNKNHLFYYMRKNSMIYLIKIVNKETKEFDFFRKENGKPYIFHSIKLALDASKQIKTWHPNDNIILVKKEI